MSVHPPLAERCKKIREKHVHSSLRAVQKKSRNMNAADKISHVPTWHMYRQVLDMYRRYERETAVEAEVVPRASEKGWLKPIKEWNRTGKASATSASTTSSNGEQAA